MIETGKWMEQYQRVVRNLFGKRILFIGLQGSYGRGEANENSDIDVVLILDMVSINDLKQYKQGVRVLPDWQLICGFVSGKEEVAGWCRADLFQFYHDTVSYYGNLDDIIPGLNSEDARRAVLLGACNLYHMCSHNYLHSNDMDILKGTYKSALFVLQAKHYSQNGYYIKSHKALGDVLSGTDLKVYLYAEQLKNADTSQPIQEVYWETMLQWTSSLIYEYKEKIC